MSVLTALTAQNTVGVRSILNVDSKFLKDQISSVFEDIYPDAVKIGMVSDAALTNDYSRRTLHVEGKEPCS